MANYNIEIKKSAAKEIEKLPPKYLPKIIGAIESLQHDPRPLGCKKLAAGERYRLRVGVYRILYEILDDKLLIYIVRVRHRKEVYRK